MSVYDGPTGGATPCVTTIPILHTHCQITHRANTTPRQCEHCRRDNKRILRTALLLKDTSTVFSGV